MCTGLLAGCKDLFHPQEDDDSMGMPTTSLQAALTWLDSNAKEGGVYTITLNAGEFIGPKTLSYNGKKVSITLSGGSTELTISLSSNGSFFIVESGVTLTLGNNVTLQGRSGNTFQVVYVDGGAFTMTGGTISGNTASLSGAGVYVGYNGAFTMSGGEISGNTASYGGGVFVDSTSTFTKQAGGVIYGSNASTGLKNTATGDSYGHAVYVGSYPAKWRNTTVGAGVTLDSEKWRGGRLGIRHLKAVHEPS